MSFESLLVHTCDIERPSVVSRDDSGKPIKSWAKLYTSLPCRVALASGQKKWQGVMAELVDYEVIVPNIDVTEQDRVLWQGNEHKILFVDHAADATGRHHHKELAVQIIRPSGNIK